jgi:hypothetical protein
MTTVDADDEEEGVASAADSVMAASRACSAARSASMRWRRASDISCIFLVVLRSELRVRNGFGRDDEMRKKMNERANKS